MIDLDSRLVVVGLCCLVTIIAMVLVVLRVKNRNRDRGVWIFLSYVFWMAVLLAAVFYEQLAPVRLGGLHWLTSRIPQLIVLLLAVSLFWLTGWFVRERASRVILAISAVILVLSSLLYWNSLSPWLDQGLSDHIAAYTIPIAWGAAVFGMAVSVIRAYSATILSLHKNRVLFWLVVMVLFISGSGFVYWSMVIPGVVLFTISTLVIGILMTTHQFPNVRLLIRNAVHAILVGTGLLGLYGICALLVITFQTSFRIEKAAVPTVILVFSLAFGINAVVLAGQNWLQHSAFTRKKDTSKVLSEYSKQIAAYLELNKLAIEIVRVITQQLSVEYAELFTVQKAKGVFVFQQIIRDEQMLAATQKIFLLDEGSPIAAAFQSVELGVSQYDLDLLPAFQTALSEERAWLSSLKMDLFMPVLVQEEWIGLIALGPLVNRQSYTEVQRTIVRSMADQASIALRNARLYDNLRVRSLENERLYQNLKSANSELARLDQAKTDFISIASHEIRTPLTQIIGYNDILTEMVQGGTVQRSSGIQMVEGVRKAARRLEEVVDTMFDVSKLETNTLDLNFSETNLAGIAASAADKWRSAIEDRRQTFTIKGLSVLGPIQADQRRMVQVFSHLIQNAIKCTPDGGQIIVSAGPQEGNEENGFVEVIVSDTGFGIAPDDLSRIFEKFYRVGNILLHSSGDTKYKGAGPGLGLTIVRGIIEAHGGRIWAESAGYNEESLPGSSFHVLLPVKQPAAPPFSKG